MTRNILYIGNALRHSGVNSSYMHTLGQRLEAAGYAVRYRSRKTAKLWRLWDMVVGVIKHRRWTDIVLLDTYSTQNFYYALVVSQWCRVLRLPYIPILHGGNLPQRLERSPRLSGLIFKHARCCVSPSQYLKEVFESVGYEHISYIPNTLEVATYPYRERSFDVPRLLWVRSFSHIYNPTLAVRVLQQLHQQYPKAELCMVGPDSGDGSLQATQELAKRLGVSVRFTGKLTKTAWLEWSANYNCFINTTDFDNRPVSVMEAMALGLPVVSTNVGGMPYLIDDGVDGVLVAPDSAEAMTTAILKYFAQPDNTRQLTEQARRKVEGYDWDVVKPQWETVLR